MMKRIILSILFLLSLDMVFAQQDEWKVKLGEQTPAFELYTKDGKTISSAELKGKIVLLNFFATWCPPCRQELPRLQKELFDVYQDRSDFVILVLAREQGWEKIDPFVQDFGYTVPIYPDLERKVFSKFADTSIPRNVLLDKDGQIIYQSIGYEAQEFDRLIELIASQLQ